MNQLALILFVLPTCTVALIHPPSIIAQEELLDEAKEKAGAVMANPSFRNMLRPIKENPAAALEGIKNDPADAVREATRIFQENKGSIDTEKLKAVVEKAQEEGVADKVKTAVEKAQEEGVVDKAVSTITQMLPSAAPPVEVPATRPAPGISGGVPTPVAMPVEPGAATASTTPVNPDAPGVTPIATAIQAEPVAAIAGAEPTVPMIPDSPGLTPGQIPAPQPLAKKYEAGSGGAFPTGDKKHMEILAKESLMDNARGVLLFTGNVFINHPEFEIKCDKLEIQLAEGAGMGMETAASGAEPTAAFKRAIASGGMVEIKRIGVDEKGKKKTQIAIARIADYNAVTKDIVLSGGPPYIQDGDRFVKTHAEDAQIIMRGNGMYEITGSDRSQIVIPVEKKAGKKKGDADPLGGLGNNPFDRLR